MMDWSDLRLLPFYDFDVKLAIAVFSSGSTLAPHMYLGWVALKECAPRSIWRSREGISDPSASDVLTRILLHRSQDTECYVDVVMMVRHE